MGFSIYLLDFYSPFAVLIYFETKLSTSQITFGATWRPADQNKSDNKRIKVFLFACINFTVLYGHHLNEKSYDLLTTCCSHNSRLFNFKLATYVCNESIWNVGLVMMFIGSFTDAAH